MPYKITVTKLDTPRTVTTEDGTPSATILGPEVEIYRQTLDELDLSKFVTALNKRPRVRKAKVAK